jgi:hypothetical protein
MFPPDSTEDGANEPAAVEICTRVTASIGVSIKKEPDNGVVAADDELAMQMLDSSSESGSKQLNEFDSTKVKKKVPDVPEEPLIKKAPGDEVVAANEELATQKSNSSSEFGSKQIDEFDSAEVMTCGMKKAPYEPPKTENIAVLFIWIYNCARLASNCMTMVQASIGDQAEGPGQERDQQGPAAECQGPDPSLQCLRRGGKLV